MSVVTFLLFVAGFVLLIGGAELLVRGSSRLAVAMGISPLVVGLTVVAFGTSAPELAVTVNSSLEGKSDLAIGNVLGSNISNILLILGIAALITHLVVDSRLVRRDVPVMILVTVIVLLMLVDGGLGRIDGMVLIAAAIGYTTWIVVASRREQSGQYAVEPADEAADPGRWYVNVALVVAGLLLLVVGARWLVDGAVELAETLGLSELVVGLTVVAIGTSLPELATAIVATVRGERDIVAGNVVGSNILNLLLVLGAGAVVSSDGLEAPDQALRLDGPVVLAASIACLPVFATYGGIRRWEGAVFVTWYVAYVAYLILEATDAPGAEQIAVGAAFALPLTFLTLGVVAVRAWRQKATVFHE